MVLWLDSQDINHQSYPGLSYRQLVSIMVNSKLQISLSCVVL